jgi:hypothetical protein
MLTQAPQTADGYSPKDSAFYHLPTAAACAALSRTAFKARQWADIERFKAD